MGAVYAATDLRLNRAVAVKVMTGRLFGNQSALRRFEREAQAFARLSHPNITAVFDFGRIGDSGAFLVMELLSGRTLRSELQSRQTLEPAVAAAWLEQILEGVNAAHRAGVVHRDLKPENILVTITPDGREHIKLLDFGLAKVGFEQLAADGATRAESLTVAGAVLGTFGYMSPEQFAGTEVDERADVFALGVIIVESLTGARPFQGAAIPELTRSVFHDTFRLPGDSPEMHELNRVLQRCLARDPGQRFSNIGELREAVLPAIRQCSGFAFSHVAGATSTVAI